MIARFNERQLKARQQSDFYFFFYRNTQQYTGQENVLQQTASLSGAAE